MGINITLSKKRLSEKGVFFGALWIGVVATFVEFALTFFGLDGLFLGLPGGIKLIFIVSASIVISKLLIVRYNKKEVI